MIKIVGNDIMRGSVKLGWIESDHIFAENGEKMGYIKGGYIYNIRADKIAYVEGTYLQMKIGSNARIPIERVRRNVVGGGYSSLMRAAIFVLMGA